MTSIIDDLRDYIDSAYPAEDPENDEKRKQLLSFLNFAEGGYVLVQWPDSQEFMEEEWFEEDAILSDDSSYFIPINRLI